MSTKTKELALALAERRSRLETRADLIRTRLLRTIDVLDDRRHHVQEIAHRAKRLAMPAAVSVLGALAIAAGTTFAIRALVVRRRQLRFGYRLASALAPFRVPPRRSFWQEALRTAGLAVVSVVARGIAIRGARLLRESQVAERPMRLLAAAPVVGA